MNYIGSKFSLLPDIERVLNNNGIPKDGIALDLFAGTGVVARFLKNRGHITYANDWQYYSYLACVAYIEHNSLPEFHNLINDTYWKSRIRRPNSRTNLDEMLTPAEQVLSYLNSLPGNSGIFYDAYCEGGECGRLYFSKENGLRIQAIRSLVEEWANLQLISHEERAWLAACLIEAADKVANTASVYGAYLKRIKRSAQKSLRLQPLIPAESPQQSSLHRAFWSDSESVLQKLNGNRMKLVYIDPPYNSRQYNANYHILETIARWDLDQLKPRGVTGLRNSRENRSDYCRKPKALAAFRRLLGSINSEYILFSYNNEGLVSKQELSETFNEFCDYVNFEEIPYRRFRADSDSKNRIYKGDSTIEYLILGKAKRQDA